VTDAPDEPLRVTFFTKVHGPKCGSCDTTLKADNIHVSRFGICLICPSCHRDAVEVEVRRRS